MALALGRTVAELEASLSAREWAEWVAFNELDPIGDTRRDAQVALIVATVRNMMRGRNSLPVNLEDCMVVRPPRNKPQRSGLELFKDLAARFGKPYGK